MIGRCVVAIDGAADDGRLLIVPRHSSLVGWPFWQRRSKKKKQNWRPCRRFVCIFCQSGVGVDTGLYSVLPSFTGFSCVRTSFSGLHCVLPSFTGFDRVLPSITEFYCVRTSFSGLHCVLPSFTGFDCFILHLFPRYFGFDRILLGFTEFFAVFHGVSSLLQV